MPLYDVMFSLCVCSESSGSTGDSPTAPQHRAEVRRSSTCDEDSASDGELEGEAMGKTQAMDAQTVTLIKELQVKTISRGNF